MPDLDTGHIFLTTLAPIKPYTKSDKSPTSFEQKVRVALAKLPTALQSPATVNAPRNSPFARNKRNHLARMFVLSDVVYNGRVGQNPIVGTIKGEDPIDPQKVDRLTTPYLVFCADIDAITKDGDPLPTSLSPAQQKEVRAAYARELWQTMESELRAIYSNCVGFDEVDSADRFAAYLDKCHVETTMPFHDYYLKLPRFHDLPFKGLIAAVAVPAVIAILALAARILGCLTVPVLGWSTLWTAVAAAAVTGLSFLLAVRFALANGARPLAPGEFDDLPSVLKALYVQQKFSDFFVEQQGASADDLYREFGAFLERTRLGDRSGPTQEPGVIRSP
ncbi:hypothetical protein NUH88_00155 [Nisaea acidiphila]|uniref:Uncharacterized protein n=1 Tax=Nisaea acidiphila TaxID=1862145 RepID=A0A9J7ATE3_9PROT|nr:hypothetical protein [Nisaea acidiphila]UUX50122.1 hypothetical protein NUH88_00155 [Nisaea acidiphila]